MGRWPSRQVREERAQLIFKLYGEGCTLAQIVAHIGQGVSVVHNVLYRKNAKPDEPAKENL